MFLYPFSPELRRLRGLALAIILLVVGFGLMIGSLWHRDAATAIFAIVLTALGVLGLFQCLRDKK